MTRGLSPGDERLVRTTARRIALQGAALVGLVVVVLAALAVLVALRQQHSQTSTLLRQAAASADDVGDPPAGTWLVIRQGSRTTATTGTPRPLPDLASLDVVARTGRSVVEDLHGDGREFRVLTQRRGPAIVQVAIDLALQHAERRRLIEALLGAGGAGLLGAGAVGLVMGRRAVRPLAQALALQRDFVADASHELRTPLTLLTTRAQLLARALRTSGAPAELQADGEGVVRDTSRLVAVVDDLLLAADSAQGEVAGPVSLGSLCRELADSAQAHAQERGLSLLVSASGDAVVEGNPVALRRAVTALLDNAMAHTPTGGAISLTVAGSGRWCTVDVSDTGPGLDPAHVDRIFDRFHSGGQRAGRRSYGLGLSLARSVADRHGGTLTVASTSSSGTTFRLRLPVAGQGSPKKGEGQSSGGTLPTEAG